MKTKLFLIPVIVLFIAVLSTCTKDKGNLTTTMYVRMTDSPGYYRAVYVDVKAIEAHTDEGGWMDLQTNAGVYDLISLTNGIEVMLAKGEIPVGNLSQIRLLLGDNNSIVVNDVEHPLTVPSGMHSGIKLEVHATLSPNVPFTILLDFDAAQSIVLTGSGNYELKPVIRTIVSSSAYGNIKGTAYPAEAQPAVVATGMGYTFSTYTNAGGDFILRGLFPGTYDVTFYPRTPYEEKTIQEVVVRGGQTTRMETVYFSYRGMNAK